LLRGIGLHVKRIKLARTAELVKEDNRLGAGLTIAGLIGGLQEAGQMKSQETEAADLEQATAREVPLTKVRTSRIHPLN
jgi:hypothetical protein